MIETAAPPLPLSRRVLAVLARFRACATDREERAVAEWARLTPGEVRVLQRLRDNERDAGPRGGWCEGHALRPGVLETLLEGVAVTADLAPALVRAWEPATWGLRTALETALAKAALPAPLPPSQADRVRRAAADLGVDLTEPLSRLVRVQIATEAGLDETLTTRLLTRLRPPREEREEPEMVDVRMAESEVRNGDGPPPEEAREERLVARVAALVDEIGIDLAQPVSENTKAALAAQLDTVPSTVGAYLADLRHKRGLIQVVSPTLKERLTAEIAARGLDLGKPIRSAEMAELAAAVGSSPGAAGQVISKLRHEAGLSFTPTSRATPKARKAKPSKCEARKAECELSDGAAAPVASSLPSPTPHSALDAAARALAVVVLDAGLTTFRAEQVGPLRALLFAALGLEE